jgi:hypothetical protein
MALKLAQDGDRITILDSDLMKDGDPETTYILQPLSRDIYKKVVRQCTSKDKLNRRTRQMEEETDWAAVSESLIDYALVEWSGILFDGKPAPCTREMKLRLDVTRAQALLDRAGMSEIETVAENKDATFRAAH